MKSMDVIKAIELSKRVDSIENIECISVIDYEAKSNGIKAYGKIDINISALKDDEIINDEQNIDLDIFAPFEKLEDENNLNVSLNSYIYEFEQELNILTIVFKFDIVGLKDDSEDEQIDVFEDLLDDSDNMMITQKYILSGYNDTYQTLASRYNVSEAYLRQINDNRIVEHKALIVISNN